MKTSYLTSNNPIKLSGNTKNKVQTPSPMYQFEGRDTGSEKVSDMNKSNENAMSRELVE